MTLPKRKLPTRNFLVQGDFWGFAIQVKAKTPGEARDKVRNMYRNGKLKPTFCSIYADEVDQ